MMTRNEWLEWSMRTGVPVPTRIRISVFLSAVALLLWSSPAFATQPTFLSKMDANVDNSSTSITTNAGTISGTDKYIACALVINSITISGSTITINDTGETLTKQLTVDHDAGSGSVIRTEFWDKVNPTDSTGTTTITATRSAGAAGVTIACVVYNGVHQTTPNGGLSSAHTNAVSNPVSVTTGADELVVDFVGVRTNSSFTVGSGQTQRSQRVGTNFGNASVGVSEASGVTSMSWSSDDAAAKTWASIATSLKPSVVSGGGTTRGLLTMGVGLE